jgi:hypothetical protein
MGCSFYSEIAMDGSRKDTVLQCREPPEFSGVLIGFAWKAALSPHRHRSRWTTQAAGEEKASPPGRGHARSSCNRPDFVCLGRAGSIVTHCRQDFAAARG